MNTDIKEVANPPFESKQNKTDLGVSPHENIVIMI